MAEMPKKRDSTVATNDLSRHFLATLAQWTGGLSPQAFGGAWLNVLTRLAVAPGRQAELARAALQKTLALAQFSGAALQGEAPRAAGTPYANRFADPAWSKFPFNVLAESFISVSDWAREAVRNVPGADAAAENIVGFTVREGLELVAPDNYLPTNPQLIRQTIDENGRNLLRGVKHLVEDVTRTFKGLGPIGVENYQVGEHVAATPGKVILRTPLMELIQYSPQTETVYAEPVLIVPAWIMKYYILDLSPKNSLVNYLTGLGHTVFMVSWKNPTAEDRNVTMDDYLTQGVHAALDAVTQVVPKHKVHAVGYCIGGTLLAIAAAELAAREDDRLASVTMFAAQTDFSEPGELSIFISPAQLAMLEAMMWKEGVLESRQMGGAFQLLRTYVRLPMFVVGTETDHVAPWRSVYKVGKLVRSADYTFCLTSGGHNAGIISGPQHPKRRHRVHTSRSGARLLSPDKYLEKVEPLPGSWWPTWAKWLEERSSARKVAPPPMGAPKHGLKPLGKAPGTYVLSK